MDQINDLLKIMIERGASDLHLRSTFPPCLRQHGDIVSLTEYAPLEPAELAALLAPIIPERNQREFENDWDSDFAYEVPELGRFRVNLLHDRFGPGAVLRTIPTKPLSADQLNLPAAVREFCYLRKGLVVVTGPTGSGKSTTLAAMVDLINKTRTDHIITIEDPIEFIHPSQRCLVTQREVHGHTRSFASALRAALREDPDIVLVGEMRDLETTETAIETAETGHLVFGTLHTNTAASTVDRIIDKFPAERQNQIRSMLASSLKGVVAQTLCKRMDGKGRAAAMEVLVVTPAIASNIREGKTYHIPTAMQVGRTLGMQLFDDALLELVKNGTVAGDEAYPKAIDKEAFAKKIAALGLRLTPASQGANGSNGSNGDPMAQRRASINAYLETIWRHPDNIELLSKLAWRLATGAHTDPGAAERALFLAEKANLLADGQDASVLDTMGAAYARSGRFDVALDAARKGLRLAQTNKQTDLASALERRIKLYERKEPMRE